MTPYDAAAWEAIQRWHEPTASRLRVPDSAKQLVTRGGQRLRSAVAQIPGSETVEDAVQSAVGGLLELLDRAAVASVRKGAVLERYAGHGHSLSDLADIRTLDLATVDKVQPRLNLRYSLVAAVEGAGAGLAISGGEILAAGGTIFGAGAGATPGVLTIVGVTAADAAAVVGACSRVTAEVGAYYGYDAELPHERLFAAGVMGVGLASQASKVAAYQQLNKLVGQLAVKKSWETLNKNVMTQIIKRVYAAFGEKITKQKLGQAVPGIGILIGAGLNARTLSAVAESADVLYRERFLREKYDLDPGPVVETDPTEVIDIADIVDAEIVNDDADEDGQATGSPEIGS
jgi:hypothetical protein